MITTYLGKIKNYLMPYNRIVKKLKTWQNRKGKALVSYIIFPFIEKCFTENTAHTNHWECYQIVNTLLELGYDVDIIHYTNTTFKTNKKYNIIFDIHNNLERLFKYLKPNCIKILYTTGTHWMFQNTAEYQRLLSLKRRKGVVLEPRRIVPKSYGIENCDYVIYLGNNETRKTFEYANKIMYNIPLSNNACFPFLENKDFDQCKKTFLWMGGSGLVHKGLDLVLDVFKTIPDFQLHIVGSIKSENDFYDLYLFLL